MQHYHEYTVKLNLFEKCIKFPNALNALQYSNNHVYFILQNLIPTIDTFFIFACGVISAIFFRKIPSPKKYLLKITYNIF